MRVYNKTHYCQFSRGTLLLLTEHLSSYVFLMKQQKVYTRIYVNGDSDNFTLINIAKTLVLVVWDDVRTFLTNDVL